MGGWKSTSGLSWSRTLGPSPSGGMVPDTWANGSAGPSISPKKKAHTTNMTNVAQATSWSSARARKRHTIAVT